MIVNPIPNGGRSIVDRLAEKFPEFYVNDDEKQRVLTTRIAQQYAYTYGGGVWGLKKRASLPAGSPVSKDSLAHFAGGVLELWDLFQGAEPPPILIFDGKAPDFTNPPDAEFVPVDPVNWLSDVIPEPNPNPNPDPNPEPPAPCDLTPVLDQLKALQAQVDGLARVVAALVAKDAPPYEGVVDIRYLGAAPIKLRPV